MYTIMEILDYLRVVILFRYDFILWYLWEFNLFVQYVNKSFWCLFIICNIAGWIKSEIYGTSYTIAQLSKKVCNVFTDTFASTDEHQWEEIFKTFSEKCNIPCCIGSIDGKHCRLKCPTGARSIVKDTILLFSHCWCQLFVSPSLI